MLGALAPWTLTRTSAKNAVWMAARGCFAFESLMEDAIIVTRVLLSRCSLNSVMDVTHGVLYLVLSVPDPRKAQTTVVSVLQDATGAELDCSHRRVMTFCSRFPSVSRCLSAMTADLTAPDTVSPGVEVMVPAGSRPYQPSRRMPLVSG